MDLAARGRQTLPDLLRSGLDVVFVGINPSLYSVQQGHYFARPSNRFWPCLSQSALSAGAQAALGVDRLEPRHDRVMLDFGIGFTDVVKRATAKASELATAELQAGARDLAARLRRHHPRVACFHGVTGYRFVLEALTGEKGPITLGAQPLSIGRTALFVVPNPSGANAHFTRQEQTGWYDRLAEQLRARPA
jgi:TDG/mug DNA glycosylase family protein